MGAKVAATMGEPPVAANSNDDFKTNAAAGSSSLRAIAPQSRCDSGMMGLGVSEGARGVRERDFGGADMTVPPDFASASRSSSDFSTSVPPRGVDASLALPSIFGESPVEPLKSDEVAEGVAERLRRRDFDGAEVEFERLPESFRRSVEGETFRGILAFAKEDYAAAAEAFRLAFNQSPNDATLAYNLATTLKILGERQSADALFESVWASDSRDDVERLKALDDDAWKEDAARRASRASKER